MPDSGPPESGGGTYNAHADFYNAAQRPDEAYISYSDNRVTVFHLNHGLHLSSPDLSGALEDRMAEQRENPSVSDSYRVRPGEGNVGRH